jgi:hypothetical protein
MTDVIAHFEVMLHDPQMLLLGALKWPEGISDPTNFVDAQIEVVANCLLAEYGRRPLLVRGVGHGRKRPYWGAVAAHIFAEKARGGSETMPEIRAYLNDKAADAIASLMSPKRAVAEDGIAL